jgi:hypothetical protein
MWEAILEVFRDQVWQFVGAFLGFVAICITIILYLRQRRRRALTYEVLSCTSLISQPEEAEGYLQIVFGEQRVQQVHLLMIRITNSGNQPIESTQYERPLTLCVKEPARILTAEVVETNRSGLLKELLPGGADEWQSRLPPDLALDTNLRMIPVRRILLNGGDSLVIKMLVSEYKPGDFSLDGRVVGVNDIEKTKRRPWLQSFRPPVELMVLLLAFTGFVFGEPFIGGLLIGLTVILMVIRELYKL